MANFGFVNGVYYPPPQVIVPGMWFTPILLSQNTQQKHPSFPKLLVDNTVDDIAEWICNLAVSKNWGTAASYSELFKQNKIDGRKIVSLQNEDLKNIIRIPKLGHRLAIIKAVKDAWKMETGMARSNSDQYLNPFVPGSQSSYLGRPYMFAPISSSESQVSNWESDPGIRDRSRANKKIQQQSTDRWHVEYPVGRSMSFSDYNSFNRERPNYRRNRGHIYGRPVPKAGRNNSGRVPGRQKEKKPFRSFKGSPQTGSFKAETPFARESREYMPSVSSTRSTDERKKESTRVSAITAILQDCKLDVSGMQKSRESMIAEKPKREQSEHEHESLSESSEDDYSSIPNASSISSYLCDNRVSGNQEAM